MIFLENSSQNARNVALETLNRVVEAEYFYLNIKLNIQALFNIPEIPGGCENIHSNSVSNIHILSINIHIPSLNIHVPILIQPSFELNIPFPTRP